MGLVGPFAVPALVVQKDADVFCCLSVEKICSLGRKELVW